MLAGALPMSRRGAGRMARWALLLAALCGLSSARAQDEAPFERIPHAIDEQIHQVWPFALSDCENGESDLLVLHGRGAAPEAEKHLTWMPCGSALDPSDARIVRRRLPPETGVVDVATWPSRPGPQLVLLSGTGLRIEALNGSAPPKTIPIPGGLPLPDRPWDVSRLPVVDDWESTGRPVALVPALRGGQLVDLESGRTRALPMPMRAVYRTWKPEFPQIEWQWMVQQVTWPTLARADDDGDGRLDLFALGRWDVWVYRAGPEGLPKEPTRRLQVRPFDPETERDPLSTATHFFAQDLDGDQHADLLLGSVGGGLTDGRTITKIHLGGPGGVEIGDTPDARRALEGGYADFALVDVDGDGRLEILETSIEFGIVQLARLLVTRRAETSIRLLGLDPEVPGGLRLLFEDDFAFRLDFAESAIAGLLPGLGDWNGDGRLDFFVSSGDEAIAFRMNTPRDQTLRFEGASAKQPVGLEGGQSRVADLDGDGLDDIVAFSTRLSDSPLVVLRNRGRLPGTRAEITPR